MIFLPILKFSEQTSLEAVLDCCMPVWIVECFVFHKFWHLKYQVHKLAGPDAGACFVGVRSQAWTGPGIQTTSIIVGMGSCLTVASDS